MRSRDDRRAFLPLWIRNWNEKRQSMETERLSGYSQVGKIPGEHRVGTLRHSGAINA